MTRIMLQREALRLSTQDRLELAQVLWASIEDELVAPVLTDWQCEVLDERIAVDDATPEAGSPWPEVKQRILARL